jgi:hypothetical protein
MQINDLGLYDSCLDNSDLNYASVIVRQKHNETEGVKLRREVKFGLCIPAVCNKPESLRFLDGVYM